MFDLEDEFIIESYRIPWLIWVQLLVMILLVIVLVFGFGVFALDLSDNPNSPSASSSSSSLGSSSRSSGKKPLFNGTSCSDGSQVEGNERGQRKMDPGTSKGIVEEDSMAIDEESVKDIVLFRGFGQADHPCNYLGLAKQAFLKCLGFGYGSDSSHKKNKHGKRD